MYPFANEATRSPTERSSIDHYLARVVDREIKLGGSVRLSTKDATSSKLRIKTGRAADMALRGELTHLRRQLHALPEEVREYARTNYQHEQDLKRRDLQDFQCMQVCALHRILMRNFVAQGLDPKTYRIGGNDRRTFERFYRVEPNLLMTKPQFITAMRRCFGDEIMQTESAMARLFESFDFERRGKVDWRALLYLLLILLQADMSYSEHLKWAFCVYTSEGILDISTPGKATLGTIKDFLVVPMVPGEHKNVKELIDECWLELAESDLEVRLLTNECGGEGIQGGMDGVAVTYAQFKKLLTDTEFSQFCRVYDRPWTYVMEEQCFHPILCCYLRDLRKMFRDSRECERFLKSKVTRTLKYLFHNWRRFVGRRNLVRWRFTVWYVRWKMRVLNGAFSKWSKQTMEALFTMNLQRGVRGYLGRHRRDLTAGLARRATLVQATGRMTLTRKTFRRDNTRLAWAATMVQKMYRGYMQRLRSTSLLTSYLEKSRCKLEQERQLWLYRRSDRAVWRITMCYRKWHYRRRIARRQYTMAQVDSLARSMEALALQNDIKRKIYQQNLSKFYADRKRSYDTDEANGKKSAAEKAVILRRKRRAADKRKKIVEDEMKEAVKAKDEAERMREFSLKWDSISDQRCEAMKKRNFHCLTAQNYMLSKDEKLHRKVLQEKIKKHIKFVLRRADDDHVPMEIPEATEIAEEEILRFEIDFEREKVAEESRRDAKRIEEEKLELERLDLAVQRMNDLKRHEWAAKKIQSGWTYFKNRKRLRALSLKTYKKHWDKQYLEYYYEHSITHQTVWEKPWSLGVEDVGPAPGWVCMLDNEGGLYYYDPVSWEMTWDQPGRTTLCEVCKKDFGVVRVSSDKVIRCEDCLNQKALAMLTEGISGDDIKFRPFNGGIQMAPTFALIREKTWNCHCIDRDGTLRDQLESLEDEQKRLKDASNAAATQGAFVTDDDEPIFCSTCTTVLATVLCEICTTHFCRPCCDLKHRKLPFSLHTIADLATMTFNGSPVTADAGVDAGADGRRSRGGGSRQGKRRRRRRPRSQGPSEGGGEGGEGGEDRGSRSRSRSRRRQGPGSGPEGEAEDEAAAEGRRARRRRREQRKRREAEAGGGWGGGEGAGAGTGAEGDGGQESGVYGGEHGLGEDDTAYATDGDGALGLGLELR